MLPPDLGTGWAGGVDPGALEPGGRVGVGVIGSVAPGGFGERAGGASRRRAGPRNSGGGI